MWNWASTETFQVSLIHLYSQSTQRLLDDLLNWGNYFERGLYSVKV